MDGCTGWCELGKQSLVHVTPFNILSMILCIIDLVEKSAKETGLQVRSESLDVQEVVKHSTKQLKKGLQDYSYTQDQGFIILYYAHMKLYTLSFHMQRSGQLHHTLHPLPPPPLHPWMKMLRVCMLDYVIHLFYFCGRQLF